MAWTKTMRRDDERRGRHYASDAANRERALIAPFLPAPNPIGRPRTTDFRDTLDALLCIAATGCQ